MAPATVLVAGAETREGLAAIRGLGRAGFNVIACGAERHSIGFYSRFTRGRHVHASPAHRDDLLAIVRRVRPDFVLPTSLPTVVALSQIRAAIEPLSVLAAPPVATLEYALDRCLSLRLAERLGVPVPRSIEGDTRDRILPQAAEMRFPVVIRGANGVRHRMGVTYAESSAELKALLAPSPDDAPALLVQEYVPGLTRCLSAVCDRGDPIALFQYSRADPLRSPAGVSAIECTEPVEEQPRALLAALLGAVGWHGVATAEFRYDRRTDRYTLIDLRPALTGAALLALHAGLNLAELVIGLYAPSPPVARPPAAYATGLTGRWLRGDLAAMAASRARHAADAPPEFRGGAGWRCVPDLRAGVHYGEFDRGDWRPGAVELLSALAVAGRGLLGTA